MCDLATLVPQIFLVDTNRIWPYNNLPRIKAAMTQNEQKNDTTTFENNLHECMGRVYCPWRSNLISESITLVLTYTSTEKKFFPDEMIV